MPAASLPLTNDLRIEQGAVWSINLTLQQPVDVPYNLTGKTIRAWVKNDYSDAAAVAQFTCAIIPPATNGQATVSLTAVQTASLPAGDYVWDLIVDDGVGGVIRIYEGPVEVTARVTV